MDAKQLAKILEKAGRVEQITAIGEIFKVDTTFNHFWIGKSKDVGLQAPGKKNPLVLMDADNCLGRFIGDQSAEVFDAYRELELVQRVGAALAADVKRPMFDITYSNGYAGHGTGTLLTVVAKQADLAERLPMFDNLLLGLKTTIMEQSGQNPYQLPTNPLLKANGEKFMEAGN